MLNFMIIHRVFTVLLFSLFLQSCGQKGPLYMPAASNYAEID